MKNIFFTLGFVLLSFTGFSQSYDGKSDSKISIGYEAYGFGNGIKAAYDYGLSDMFSIGGGGIVYFDGDENDYLIFIRSHVHLGIPLDLPRKFDMYPGLQMGYLSSEKIGVAGYLGLRYFISKKVGIYAEIGNTGSIGLSINV